MPTRFVNRRRFLLGAGAAGMGGLLAACGGGSDDTAQSSPAASGKQASRAPIAVGLLLPLSGVYAALGKDMREAFELYIQEHNNALGGRTVNLVVEDEESSPEVGIRKAQKLIRQDKVTAVTGIVSSAVALAVRDLFHESEIPLVVSIAGANDLTRKAKSPFIFRTAFTNWQPTYAIGGWVYHNVSKDGVYTIAPDYAAGREFIGGFREAFEKAGGKIMGEAFPPFGTTQDYQPYLSTIRSAGAKMVFAFFGGGEAVAFVKQYQEFGLKSSIPLVGMGSLTDEGVLPAQGDAALGIRTTLNYTPLLDNPANQAFVAAFRKKYNRTPTMFAMHSWDAAGLLDAALLKLGGEAGDTRALAKAMESIDTITSPRGSFKLDPATHNPIQTFYVREVRKLEGGSGNVVVHDLGVLADPG